MTGRLPASVTISLAAHAGVLLLFLGIAHEAPKQAQRVVDGVDLLIQPARPKGDENAVKKPELSTMDFLKMALPSTPRAAAPQDLQVKVVERKLAALDAPKLEEAKRRDLGPKLEALDLARSRTKIATVDVLPQSRRQAAATLAALPRLEEVGRRRVKDLPQALALEERRREATSLAGLEALPPSQPVSRRQALAAVATLSEAAPVERSPRKGLDSLLPDRLELKPAAAVAPKMETIGQQAPKLERRQAQAATEGPKKAVEIEGPLEKRRVVAYEIPTFPDWAKSVIMEASVSIRFTVGADGEILPGMRVERGSGYGRLDRHTMESLKKWRFAPLAGAGAQWGVITFRFVTE